MVAANNADFLEGSGGTVDPFTGLAPAMTPEEEAAMRLLKLRRDATKTANINLAPGGYSGQRGVSDRDAIDANNRHVITDRFARTGSAKGDRDGFFTNLMQDPVTLGILAAPAAITGIGAAVGGAGALGFGLGEGSIAGAPAVGYAAESAPFAMASPFPAAGAAGAAPGVAGTAGAAAAPSLGGMIAADLPALGALGVAAAPAVINQLTKGRTKEQKQLLETQKKMAEEAARRQGQLQDQRMNALGQQMLAFNPRNQMLAQMFGPEAAFQPEQIAQMVQGQPPAYDPKWTNYQGNDPKIRAEIEEYIRRLNEYNAAEEQRRNMIMGGFQAPGPGPAPINMPAPQAARRF